MKKGIRFFGIMAALAGIAIIGCTSPLDTLVGGNFQPTFLMNAPGAR